MTHQPQEGKGCKCEISSMPHPTPVCQRSRKGNPSAICRGCGHDYGCHGDARRQGGKCNTCKHLKQNKINRRCDAGLGGLFIAGVLLGRKQCALYQATASAIRHGSQEHE